MCAHAVDHNISNLSFNCLQQVVGDDMLCTNPERVKRAIEQKCVNALLLKVRKSHITISDIHDSSAWGLGLRLCTCFSVWLGYQYLAV